MFLQDYLAVFDRSRRLMIRWSLSFSFCSTNIWKRWYFKSYSAFLQRQM